MKKIYFLLFMISIASHSFVSAQCNNGSAFGTGTAPSAGNTTEISTCNYAGEYATINGVAAATDYECISSEADYLTIRQGTSGGAVIASGTTPLSWTSTVAGTYYLHINTNAACGTQNNCRTTFISQPVQPSMSCGDNITYCYTNGNQTVGTYTVSNPGDIITIDLNAGYFEPNYDYLEIYEGNGIGGTLLYRSDGDVSGSYTSTTGTITVNIGADGSVNCGDNGYTNLDFNITCSSSCYDPTNLNANTSITTADLFWTAGGSETAWDIEWGASGFGGGGAGTIISGTSNNPYTLTGLSESTSYDYYVRAMCGSGDYSAWAGPYTFTTTIDLDPLMLSDCDGNCMTLIAANGTAPYLMLDGIEYGVKYGKVQKIEVNNAYGSAITDYQIELNIAYSVNMKSDFGDLRFYNSSGSILPYYIESFTTSSTAHIFVKSNLDNGINNIYMTYGNDALTSLSNAATTMAIFEDMTTAPNGSLENNAFYDGANQYVRLTTATNSISGQIEYDIDFTEGFIAEFELWGGGGSGADGIYVYSYANFTPTSEGAATDGYVHAYQNWNGELQVRWDGTTINTVAETNISNSTWRPARVIYSGTDSEMYLDGNQRLTYTDVARAKTGSLFGFAARTGGANNEHRVRGLSVRKYTPLVSVTYGIEEEKDLCGYTNNTTNNGIIISDAGGNTNTVNNIDVDDFSANLGGAVGNIVKVCQLDDWVYYGNNANRNFSFGVLWNDDYINNGTSYNENSIRNATVFITDDGLDSEIDMTTYAIPFATFGMSRYWNVNNALLDGNVDIRFFYDNADKNNAITTAQVFATANSVDYEVFKWFKIVGTDYAPTAHLTAKEVINEIELTDVGGATVDGVLYSQFDEITGFSGGTGASGAGNNAGSALPVELLSFTATPKEDYILLNWSTASELNNAGFDVQRSLDGENFEKIGWVDGNSTTTSINYYQLRDQDIKFNTTYYYRLKQIDFDGDFEYSNIIVAQIKKDKLVIIHNIYPNPSDGNVFVDISYTGIEAEVTMKITNILGATISTQVNIITSGDSKLRINKEMLAAGTYVIDIQINKERTTHKLFVVN